MRVRASVWECVVLMLSTTPALGDRGSPSTLNQ